MWGENQDFFFYFYDLVGKNTKMNRKAKQSRDSGVFVQATLEKIFTQYNIL